VGCQKAEVPAPTAPTAPTPAQPEVIVLNAASCYAPNTMAVDTDFFQFIDMVNYRAGGELVIDYKGGPEVVPTKELPEAIRKGIFDIAWTYGASYTSVVPEMVLLSLSPTGAAGTHQLALELKSGGVYDYVRTAHEREGFYFLGRADSQYVSYMISNTKVGSMDDFAGQNIMAGGSLHQDFVKALGAAVVMGYSSDVYTGLERKLVDSAAVLTAGKGVQFKIWDIIKYWYLPAYKTNSNCVLIMNLDTWNKLPKKLQDVMFQSHVDTWTRTEWADLGRDRKALAILESQGIEMIPIPKDEVQRWTDLYLEAAKESLKKLVSDQVYQEMLAIADAVES